MRFLSSTASLRLDRTRARTNVRLGDVTCVEPRRTMHCAGKRSHRGANSAFRTAASLLFLGRRHPRLSTARPCSRTRQRNDAATTAAFQHEAVAIPMSPDMPEERMVVSRVTSGHERMIIFACRKTNSAKPD